MVVRDPAAVLKGIVVFVSVTGPAWSARDATDWVAGLFPTPIPRLERYVMTGAATDVVNGLRDHRAGATTVVAAIASPRPMDVSAELLAEWSNR